MLSELRKGPRADSGVRSWFDATQESELMLSVLVLGEIRQGIERSRRRDPRQARNLEAWLRQLTSTYSARLLPVDEVVADRWGELNAHDPIPVMDGLLAATALVHGLTVVTRNTQDFVRTRVPVHNPFAQ